MIVCSLPVQLGTTIRMSIGSSLVSVYCLTKTGSKFGHTINKILIRIQKQMQTVSEFLFFVVESIFYGWINWNCFMSIKISTISINLPFFIPIFIIYGGGYHVTLGRMFFHLSLACRIHRFIYFLFFPSTILLEVFMIQFKQTKLIPCTSPISMVGGVRFYKVIN